MAVPPGVSARQRSCVRQAWRALHSDLPCFWLGCAPDFATAGVLLGLPSGFLPALGEGLQGTGPKELCARGMHRGTPATGARQLNKLHHNSQTRRYHALIVFEKTAHPP
jgi:hypothetical protein